jgi:hypothetical protein
VVVGWRILDVREMKDGGGGKGTVQLLLENGGEGGNVT